ncbi:ATP-binding cassette domain-containing protein [Sporolactobacillus spathodeae]|uniref:UvrABC system protein A n=1 Tax=Sporolactobacillus spathodeae TaxID=1465502 RepID=A0ABS2Q648_9BACL|nr:ATP-binding cassette domain-containing protein [Sporolactobacillus spathodeae]MBM7657235.1 excinuclease ABC subunit A [Sporolactobacillus spathodeae]
MKKIEIINATQNNLKNISVSIPYYAVTAVTGDSGCGKSSLVYDTIYAESMRLITENMLTSTFSQKILPKPKVESIQHLVPAISLDQNCYNQNPRSTVSTFMEIADTLRVLFSIFVNQKYHTNLTGRNFSKNDVDGYCPLCKGNGWVQKFSLEKLIPDPSKTLNEGGILFFSGVKESFEMKLLEQVCRRHHIVMDIPIRNLPESDVHFLLYGDTTEKYVVHYSRAKKKNCQRTLFFQGAITVIGEKEKHILTPMIFKQIEKYLSPCTCSLCGGKRLKANVLQYNIFKCDYSEVEHLELPEILRWIGKAEHSNKNESGLYSVQKMIESLKARIRSMLDLKLEYLSLDRSIPSLSGGELQRLRLSKQISCSLTEILYIFDEPCKGLHFKNIQNIIHTMKKLVDKGNTIIAIEHNTQFLNNVDYCIELGPGGGPKGGKVLFKGIKNFYEDMSMTKINHRHFDKWINIKRANYNNIREQNCSIPMKAITIISGVSGSGKTTLLNEVIYKSLYAQMPHNCEIFSCEGNYEKVYAVNQQPIGKNIRSSVISFLGIGQHIRELFANTKTAKENNLSASFFSLNCKEGRCERCLGSGYVQMDSTFFSNILLPCDECNGTRFKDFILSVKYNGKSINDVLNMDISEAYGFFAKQKYIEYMLKCLIDIGLDYIKLGQLSKNLSGGEAQRIKLAKALGQPNGSNNIFLLDEPTSGLSASDILRLENVLNKLVDEGNTLIIIEHNIKFIHKNADYIIDFGLKGGNSGGKIIDEGSLQEILNRGKVSWI